MDTREFANPDCSKCSGKGIVEIGPLLSDRRICNCVLLNQRLSAAQIMLQTVLPKRALEMTFSSFDTGGIAQNERALELARSFVDNYPRAAEEGWVIGFYGEPRSGKTHLAVATLQKATKRYSIRPQLLNLPLALKVERERFNNSAIESPFSAAARADLLVIDDLGAEYERQAAARGNVSWLSEQLYELLEARFMEERPTIYTTNLSPSDMAKKYSNEAWKRVFARLDDAEVASVELLRNPGLKSARAEAARDRLFGVSLS